MAPFFAASADGKLFGLFERNLVVTDADLVVDRDQAPGEPSISCAAATCATPGSIASTCIRPT